MPCRRCVPLLCVILPSLICLALLAGAAPPPPPAAPGSRFSRRRPSAQAVDAYLEAIAASGAGFNHGRVGATAALDSPSQQRGGWRVVRLSIPLGTGEAAYTRGREALRRWRMHEGSRDTGIVKAGEKRGGKDNKALASHPPVATVARAYGGLAWVLNPCRVAYEAFDVDDREQRVRWSEVAYATTGRHLIAGEERMRVVWRRRQRRRRRRERGGGGSEDADGNDNGVTFEVLSIARGSGVLGRLVFPFNRGMQTCFFREQLRCMRRIVAEEEEEEEEEKGKR